MRLLKPTIVALGLALAGVAAGQSLPKLPKDFTLPKSAKSPGPVVFKHSSHIDAKAADCTSCHPKMFKITEAGKTADGQALTHKVFKKGEQCGSCHNEKKAFGLDECERCHTSEDE